MTRRGTLEEPKMDQYKNIIGTERGTKEGQNKNELGTKEVHVRNRSGK